jgi:uncharacterized membrane protein HdeD (DUF308 family)
MTSRRPGADKRPRRAYHYRNLSRAPPSGCLEQQEHRTMSGDPLHPEAIYASELAHLRKLWWLMLLFGILLAIAGVVAIGSPWVFTPVVVLVTGILLLIGSGFEMAAAVISWRWRGFILHMLTGLLYLVVGALLVERPVQGAIALTLFVAIALVVQGMFRIIVSLLHRFHGWFWLLLSGIISLLLGIFIWRRWPWDALWVIGLFVGIEMLFSGITWITLALSVRFPPKVDLLSRP